MHSSYQFSTGKNLSGWPSMMYHFKRCYCLAGWSVMDTLRCLTGQCTGCVLLMHHQGSTTRCRSVCRTESRDGLCCLHQTTDRPNTFEAVSSRDMHLYGVRRSRQERPTHAALSPIEQSFPVSIRFRGLSHRDERSLHHGSFWFFFFVS